MELLIGFVLGMFLFYGLIFAWDFISDFRYHWTNGRKGGGCHGHSSESSWVLRVCHKHFCKEMDKRRIAKLPPFEPPYDKGWSIEEVEARKKELGIN